MTDLLTFEVGFADRHCVERRCALCDAVVNRPKSPYCSTACYRKAWEIANRERRAAYQRDWYQANRDRLDDLARAWQKANPERFREIQRAWYGRNREQAIATSTRWIEENRDRFNAVRNARMRTPKGRIQRAMGNGRRRARMLENGYETIPANEWAAKLADYGGCCAYCGDAATERDHIVPLARGGTHTLDNLVPACGPCNRVKHDQLPGEWRSR
jgi:5-methylcytosine-specific restriction endonuclease McrA